MNWVNTVLTGDEKWNDTIVLPQLLYSRIWICLIFELCDIDSVAFLFYTVKLLWNNNCMKCFDYILYKVDLTIQSSILSFIYPALCTVTFFHYVLRQLLFFQKIQIKNLQKINLSITCLWPSHMYLYHFVWRESVPGWESYYINTSLRLLSGSC